MAAPVTHVVLAESVFNKFFNLKNKKDFLVGTSFPDIRYLGVIERSKTHFADIGIKDIQVSDSFLGGVKFHNLVDQVREKFMAEAGLYSMFPESKLLTQAVKVFEDRVLYKKINDWGVISSYFNGVTDEEKTFDIEESQIDKWHKLLQIYFSNEPDDVVVKQYIRNIGMSEDISVEIIRVVNGVIDKGEATKIVDEFYNQFEKLVGNFG